MRNFDLFSIAPPRSDLPLFSIAPTHPTSQGQKDFAIILAKIRDTAIFNRL